MGWWRGKVVGTLIPSNISLVVRNGLIRRSVIMMAMIRPVDRNPLILLVVMFSVKTVMWWVEKASWHFPKQMRDSQVTMRFRSGPPRMD
jgi:hypothetical protein